ncbi:pantoate--beta-alanine ligase-like [Arachis ipaensis]|uniref:pantoate--beta-alanine ligase-like n=1 Tax=Arachis ipaensis TaxID=130454 RepID=UPI000A2B15B3|nr:pantoate--beta-alanine ligase-like [Arachis ipaensis]
MASKEPLVISNKDAMRKWSRTMILTLKLLVLKSHVRMMALSINKSLLKAKSAAADGQVHCEKLRNLVVQCITKAGGQIDYAEIVDQENLEKVEFINGSPVVLCVAACLGK